MTLDVSCASLYADIKRRVYTQLPTEYAESVSGTEVGKLEKDFVRNLRCSSSVAG